MVPGLFIIVCIVVYIAIFYLLPDPAKVTMRDQESTDDLREQILEQMRSGK